MNYLRYEQSFDSITFDEKIDLCEQILSVKSHRMSQSWPSRSVRERPITYHDNNTHITLRHTLSLSICETEKSITKQTLCHLSQHLHMCLVLTEEALQRWDEPNYKPTPPEDPHSRSLKIQRHTNQNKLLTHQDLKYCVCVSMLNEYYIIVQ